MTANSNDQLLDDLINDLPTPPPASQQPRKPASESAARAWQPTARLLAIQQKQCQCGQLWHWPASELLLEWTYKKTGSRQTEPLVGARSDLPIKREYLQAEHIAVCPSCAEASHGVATNAA